MPYDLRSIFSQHTARGARSTALHALQWTLGIVLTGITASLLSGAPTWLSIAMTVFAGLVLTVFLFAYVFLLLTNPDALRSEQYFLSKLAIEKGLVGDSNVGLVDADVVEMRTLAPLIASTDQEEVK